MRNWLWVSCVLFGIVVPVEALKMGSAVSLELRSAIIAQSSSSQQSAGQKSRRSYKSPPRPPKGIRAPGSRSSAASRSCSTSKLQLAALAPEFAADENSLSASTVWGQTIASRPTLLFFVPFTDPNVKLEFALQLPGNDEDVHRTAVPVPRQAGIVAIQLPSHVALEVNRSYRWTLKAQLPPCPNTSPELTYVQGWIDRVNMPSGKAGTSEGKSLEYAEQGLWYDAVAALARERSLNPKDEDLKQEWADLLRSANLEALADKPLLN